MRRQAALLSLLVLAPLPALAQASIAEIQSGQELLYGGRFGAAEIYFAGLSRRYPLDAAGPTLEAASLIWWSVARGEEQSQKDSIELLLDDGARRAQTALDAAPDDSARVTALLWLATARGYRARQANEHGSAWTAMKEARAMHGALERAAAIDTTCADCLLGLGVYDYGLARVGFLARLVAKILGLGTGNVEHGLLRMRRAADAGVLFRTEARWVFANVLLREGAHDPAQREEGHRIIGELALQFPDNPVFQRAQASDTPSP